ncbi:hypothetical protein HSX11_06010 [Oxalobacteraceae bacterium]|nr:hypothetical protein [Oxalobacteraceae bacterium]
MRLPGTRYQEHGWEQVRKLLGHCSLQVFRQFGAQDIADRPGEPAPLERYVEAMALALHAVVRSARAEAPGNSYGDSVGELALSLVLELPVHASFWVGLQNAIGVEQERAGAFWLDGGADGILRKKVNDMFAGLRDKVDADSLTVATGRNCSPNKIYTYRMLDTAYREIESLFAGWQQHSAQVGAILGRELEGMPIEVRRLKSIADCEAGWIIRWSATLERFGGAPGPLDTRSKRFASLKNSPEKIAAMLADIGDYEQLSANLDSAESWQGEDDVAALWLEDYWRVLDESVQQEAASEDEEVATPGAAAIAIAVAPGPVACPDAAQLDAERALASALSLPPRYLELARAAQDGASWAAQVMAEVSLPIRLAVYQKLLGAMDDSYPEDWLDPQTAALPSLQQLAALDRISMPTLRKRRNEAIDTLYAANAAKAAPHGRSSN